MLESIPELKKSIDSSRNDAFVYFEQGIAPEMYSKWEKSIVKVCNAPSHVSRNIKR
jgi:hypothetical protein